MFLLIHFYSYFISFVFFLSVIPGPIDKSSIRTQCLEKGTWAMGISWNIPASELVT